MTIESKQMNWFANKIKGGFAEAVCRAHFEALGYAVESTGIERIAPLYCLLAGRPAGSYIGDVRKFQHLPDFLISRIHPSTAGEMEGKADAVFVEVKYRTEVVLDDFTAEILNTYGELIEKKIHFIVYLVCKRYKQKVTDSDFASDCHVMLNFFNTDVSKTNGDTGWRKAGEWVGFTKNALYRGKMAGCNFNQVYSQMIQPVLVDMLD